MPGFDHVADILEQGTARRIYPAATIEVGRGAGTLWTYAAGTLTYDPAAAPARSDAIFDLASLTKVIATASLMMRAVDEGRLSLDSRVSEHFRTWRGADRAAATVRDLLAHSAGLTAYLPFFRDHRGRDEFERAICTLPLEYPPRTKAVYSDLGFILLGFLAEDLADSREALDAQFAHVAASFTTAPLTFNPPREWRSNIAPTELDPWRGRLLAGEVHDENAWALGGAAGHAGLFGTAEAVGDFARAVLRTIGGDPILAQPETMRTFIRKTSVPGSSRALGWDTMLPSSSCGTLLSRSAIGHTGFTGTSLWIDWEQDFYVVLLTNRVHPTREGEGIRELRREIHDAVARSLGP